MATDDKIRDEKINIILTEKQQKFQHYHSEKLININILQVKKLPPDQKRVIEQLKFTYSLRRKPFEKKTKKTIEDQGEKEIKEIEDHRKEFVKCNELMKKDFNIEKDDIPLEKQKEILNNFFAEKYFEFQK